jgi:uncharacterized protein (UPF0332 family)
VTPEAADLLAKAQRILGRADELLLAGLPAEAARNAYIAALSAARALVFEKKQKAPKTHSGTRTLLSELVAEGIAIPRELTQFLSEGYLLKTKVDYETNDEVSEQEAAQSVQRAKAFFESVSQLLD